MKRPAFFFAKHNLPFTLCGLLIEVLCVALYHVSELRLLPLSYRPATAWVNGATTVLLLLAFVPFWIAGSLATDERKRPDKKLIVFFSVLFSLTLFLTSGPLLSEDVYSYSFYGRALPFYGWNPYKAAPVDHHDDPVAAYAVSNGAAKNPYGPVWTLISMAPAALGGNSVSDQIFFFNLLAIDFFYASLYVLVLLMKELGQDRAVPAALLLFSWNPFLLIEFVQNGHNDMAMIFFILLAFLFLTRGKEVSGALAFGASCLVKFAGLAVAPVIGLFLLMRRGPWNQRERLVSLGRFAAIFAVLAVALYAPFWGNGQALGGLSAQIKRFDYSDLGAIPLHLLILASSASKMPNDPAVIAPVRRLTTIIFAGIFSVFLLIAQKKIGDAKGLIGASATAFVILFISVCWFMPWYYAWIIPLLILLGRYPETIFVTFVALLSYQFPVGTLQLIGLVWFGGRETARVFREHLRLA